MHECGIARLRRQIVPVSPEANSAPSSSTIFSSTLPLGRPTVVATMSGGSLSRVPVARHDSVEA